MFSMPTPDPYTQPSRKEFRWSINITPSEDGKLEVIVTTKLVTMQNSSERRTSFLTQEASDDMYQLSRNGLGTFVEQLAEELEIRSLRENSTNTKEIM